MALAVGNSDSFELRLPIYIISLNVHEAAGRFRFHQRLARN